MFQEIQRKLRGVAGVEEVAEAMAGVERVEGGLRGLQEEVDQWRESGGQRVEQLQGALTQVTQKNTVSSAEFFLPVLMEVLILYLFITGI